MYSVGLLSPTNRPIFLVNRTTVQVKTHAQMVLKRMDLGEDVFAELDSNLKTSKNR